MKETNKWNWVGFVSTYPPRECGIATFTQDLVTAVDKKLKILKSKIIAINNNGSAMYNYGRKVRFQIDQTELDSYSDAAAFINGSNTMKLVNIQYEFGIFGGKYGDYIIPFLKMIKKPVVTTFHSVIENPKKYRKEVVRGICKCSNKVVVTINKAKEILEKDYGINKSKIEIIPHGIHPVDFISPSRSKRTFGKNRIILSTFGLINPRKGLENVIHALPAVIKKYPNIIYIILGETHPNVRLKEGENYRKKLIQKVKKLGLKKHVKFYNKYLPLRELFKYLKATDIYITPYNNKNQVSSGALSYAFGCGRACISTPYYFAKDLLDNKRGILIDFKNPNSIANAIIHILDNPDLKKEMEKKAYDYSRFMIWPRVAEHYLKLFNQVLEDS